MSFLKSRREINPRKIGLIGHSEGGLVAPLAASRSDDVAFIVLMAGTGVPGDEILDRQGRLIAAAMGQAQDPAKLEKNQALNRQIAQILGKSPIGPKPKPRFAISWPKASAARTA